MRKPMVTRTITSTKVQVLCADTTKAELFNKSVIVPRTYEDDEKLLKALHKIIDNDQEVVVSIVGKDVQTALYGMSEEDFVANAILLDEETRKPIEA